MQRIRDVHDRRCGSLVPSELYPFKYTAVDRRLADLVIGFVAYVIWDLGQPNNVIGL